MADTDPDDQNDELLALASIYDETMFKMHKDIDQSNSGTLSVRIELTKPYYVKLSSHDIEHEVHHLPPITLSFTLPPNYPSANPPQYSISCVWLTNYQIEKVRSELDEIWSSCQGSVVLFMWMNFLLNDLLECLHINSPICVNAETLAAVVDNDQIMLNKVFEVTSFRCDVCFNDRLGAMCIRFEGCGHVFCRACVRDYFQLHIAEGSVSNLKCLSANCSSQALPSQVKELVSANEFERYDRLLLQRSLETMNDVVYCPRQACMCPVLVDQTESIGSCPSCRYVFCTLCKRVYHGISPCKIISDNFAALRNEYLAADEAGKRELERRYGRKHLRQAVEESFNVEWLKDNCKKCPHCQTQIEKKDGCNKMTCTKCCSFFCWICLTIVSRKDPYAHFNSRSSPCYNKLFLGVDVEEEFEEVDDFVM